LLLLYKEKVLQKLKEEYPAQDKDLDELILFGSVAKEQYSPESDIDIVLITNNKKLSSELFSNFRSRILMDYGVIINSLYITAAEFDKSIDPIYRTIKQEGIILWKKKRI